MRRRPGCPANLLLPSAAAAVCWRRRVSGDVGVGGASPRRKTRTVSDVAWRFHCLHTYDHDQEDFSHFQQFFFSQCDYLSGPILYAFLFQKCNLFHCIVGIMNDSTATPVLK